MANTIKPKRSSVAGNIPTTSNISQYEIAMNTADKKLFTSDGTNIIQLSAGELQGLADVTISSPSQGQSLKYNSVTSKWENSTAGAGDVVGPASATDNAIARFDTTTGKLIQNSLVTVSDTGTVGGIESVLFNNTPSNIPTAVGSLYWDNADGNQTLNLVMAGGLVNQSIGEEQYYRIKATSAITNGQVVMFTGTLGASGALTGAPATGLTSATAFYVMGIATEDIPLNSWGYVTSFGLVRGIDTSTFVDGDVLYLNPAVAGGLTTSLPLSPNPKVLVGACVYSSTSNGSIFVRPSIGGEFGAFEGDVEIINPVANDLLQHDGTHWLNVAPSTITGVGSALKLTTARTISLSGDVTGSVAFDGSANVSITATIAANSVALGTDTTGNYVAGATAGTGISVTGTAGEGWSPTITNTDLGSSQNIFKTITITDTDSVAYSWVTDGSIIANSNNDTLTIVDGVGIDIDSDSGNHAIRIKHSDTSTQASINNSNGTVIQNITLDDFGHITAIGSVNLDGRYYTETESDGRYELIAKQSTVTLTSTDNLNSITDGWYTWNSVNPVNSPFNYAILLQASDPNQKIQLAFGGTNPGGLAIRRADSGTFYNWANVWTDTNDGANSGLDADLLDGNHAAAFYLATNPSGYTTNTGTVTSVAATAGTGISVTGSPITTSGTLTITNTAPNVTTNISTTHAATTVTVNSSDGTNGTINAATTALAGVMTSTDKTKLNGIATGATANTGTVTSVDGTGGYGGLTLSGTVTTSGNLTMGGTPTGTWPISVSGSSASTTGNAATATSSPLLSSLGNYVWSASTLPASYPSGIQSSFVSSAQGFQEYGSIVTVKTYTGGGGSLQLYTPYSPTYGGIGLQVRFGNYDVSSGNSWTAWKTLLASDNYNTYSPTLTGGGASGTWGINITGNADTTDGYHATTASTVNTIAVRDSSGDINARLFRSEYDITNATIGYIMTQVDTVSNNYIRPTTPAQFRAAVTDSVYSPTTHNHSLDSLSNVTITLNSSGEILKWNGTAWINSTLAEASIADTSHNHTLDSLSNVTITSNSSGEILKWNGTAWINNTLAEAGIAATSHSHSNYMINNGNTSTTGYIQAEGFVNSSTGSLSIFNPQGASYATTTSSITGAIKITLPQSWTATMMRMTIRIYEYTTNEAFEVVCGGYNPASTWANNPFAYIIGSPNVNRNFNVRFGHDGTNCCIYIGETTSTWSYPQVAVTQFVAGYSNYTAEQWNDGWSVGFATALGTITATVSNSEIGRYLDGQLVLHAGNYNTYAPTKTGGGASGTWGISVTGSSASTTGNAATATILQTTRTINGTNFNGSANITTANWGTARTINGVSVNGSTNYTLEPYVEDDEATNATRYLVFVDNSTAGYKRLNEDSSLTYNPSTNTLSAGTVTATTVTSTSDISKKTNVETIKNPLSKVTSLRGVTFDWKDTGESDIGIIAQEIEQVLPEVVHTDNEGFKSVSYGNIVGLLIEAIKDQQKQIDELKQLVSK